MYYGPLESLWLWLAHAGVQMTYESGGTMRHRLPVYVMVASLLVIFWGWAPDAGAKKLGSPTVALFLCKESKLDKSQWKLRFPFVSGDYLLFLVETQEAPSKRVRAYALDPLTVQMKGSPLPVLAFPDDASTSTEPVLGAKSPPVPIAFFHKAIFAVEQGWAMGDASVGERTLWAIDDGADGDRTRRAVPKTKVAVEGKIRFFAALDGDVSKVTTEGLYVNDELVFAEGEVFSFDQSKKAKTLAIYYKAHDGAERVCVKRSPSWLQRQAEALLGSPKDASDACTPVSEGPEFDPKFSEDGTFLAVATRREQTSDLHIYSVTAEKTISTKRVKDVQDVVFLDISLKNFLNFSSYEWLGNSLFFVKKDGAGVYSIKCTGQTCEDPTLWEAPRCFRSPTELVREAPVCGGDSSTRQLSWFPFEQSCVNVQEPPQNLGCQLELKRIVRAYPFRRGDAAYVATESQVRHQLPEQENAQSEFLSRIVVFKLEGYGK